MDIWAYLLLGLPLVGFVALFVLRTAISRKWAGILATGVVALSFGSALLGVSQIGALGGMTFPLFHWFDMGGMSFQLNMWMDPLSLLMAWVITGVGALIHLYAMGYMAHDDDATRFFSYLNLFVFFMLMLVCSDSYLGMFVGWEGVGLCSYLLIGFWHQKHSYNQAAKKAFLMNRIGDLGFVLGLFGLLATFGSTSFGSVFLQAGALPVGWPMLTFITLCLLVGAIGKSAQVPLYTWLPDAMAGPTPVSALIHAATMVTAGVYMIARSHVLYALSPLTLTLVLWLGVVTAAVGAVIALFQRDIKKVLAYSTVSQLGFMFVALGLGCYTVALFHMVTHAFFKALLFLGAGSVIHALDGEQDMSRMGGLTKALPVTSITFGIGVLAISGLPPLSGFFSKDAILIAAAGHSWGLFAVMVILSLMTAGYMFRLFYLTFLGKSRGAGQPHESPWTMTLPLGVLAVLSLLGGVLNLPTGRWAHGLTQFLSPAVQDIVASHADMHALEMALFWGTLGVLAVVAWGTVRYFSPRAAQLQSDASMGVLHRLIYRKLYVDELYDAVIVRPFYGFAHLSTAMEKAIAGWVMGTSAAVLRLGAILRHGQTGNIGVYALVMVLGLVLILVGWVLPR